MSAAAARFDGLEVTVATTSLPALPTVVEVAPYRIAMEAVTNAARHAGARSARVCFEAEGTALVVIVTDDGRGLAATARPGTGMRSMRERATRGQEAVELDMDHRRRRCVSHRLCDVPSAF